MNTDQMITLWTDTRKVTKKILSKPFSEQQILLFFAIPPLLSGTFAAAMESFKSGFENAYLIAIVLSVLVGVTSSYIYSLFAYWMGKLLKGKGTGKRVRTAVAITMIAVAANTVITSIMTILSIATGVRALHMAGMAAGVVLGIWIVVIYSKAIAEAEKFPSSWRGFLCILPMLIATIGTPALFLADKGLTFLPSALLGANLHPIALMVIVFIVLLAGIMAIITAADRLLGRK